MFERNLPEAGFDAALESDALRPLDWPALVARLSAAQDLRRALAARAGGNFAGFSSAKMPPVNTALQSVNPTNSAHGKASRAMMPAVADVVATGTREL